MPDTETTSLVNLNRFHRLSLWCRDCDHYWQIPNYLVVIHGKIENESVKRMLKLNLYMYHVLFDLDIERVFGPDFNFETEMMYYFEELRERFKTSSKDITIDGVDIIRVLQENMDGLMNFIIQMKGSFDTMALRVLTHSPKHFINKLMILKKNILSALETDNLKCAIDNLMDLNIAGFDVIVQATGTLFNCFYILSIDVCKPETSMPGVLYCENPGAPIERLGNISVQSFFYKYKRRWLIFYREVLLECKSLFGDNIKYYEELRSCGNLETVENAIFDLLVARNVNLCKELSIIKYIERYPKDVKRIHEWWSGRSKENMQTIYKLMDNCLSMEKKTALMPFLLCRNMNQKDRIYYESYNALQLFSRMDKALANSIGFILRIYPVVFEQVYFPERKRYESMNPPTDDILDNISDKETLRKCENRKCQERNGGRNVIWNLNMFDNNTHSFNSIIKELIKNPEILKELFVYIQKNFKVDINVDKLTKKIYKKVKV